MMALVWVATSCASLALALALLTMPQERVLNLYSETTHLRTRRFGVAPIGRRLRRLAGREPDERQDSVVGRSVVLGLVLALLDPVFGACAAAISLAIEVLGRARRNKVAAAELGAGVVELIDLFAVALLSGHNVATAVSRVSRWTDRPLAEALLWCQRQSDQGRPLSDALEELPARGYPQVRSLVAALVAHDRYGAAIVDSLVQLSAENRAERRRHAETAARRLPIKLLFPLVVCVLPAFLLLTVVPVVAETLSAFNGFASP